MVDVPLIRVAGKLDGDDVIHVDDDPAGHTVDGDVFFLDRKTVLAALGQDGLTDYSVVVSAGRLRLVDDGFAHLGGFHFDRDHFPGDVRGDRQDDQTDETPEISLTLLTAADAHKTSVSGESIAKATELALTYPRAG